MKTVYAYFCVLFECKHDFGSAIPPRSNVFRHETRFRPGWLGGLDGSGKTKIAHLEVAIGVEKQIGGLEVTMDDIRRMESLERAQGLVDEILGMVVGEILGPDYAMHVGFHQFLDDWRGSGYMK